MLITGRQKKTLWGILMEYFGFVEARYYTLENFKGEVYFVGKERI